MIRAYLDNNATTRLAPEALTAMMPYLTDQFLNPSSRAGQVLGHSDPITLARKEVALLLGDEDAAADITLVSGASEANSWAIDAVARGEPGRIAISAIEHPSVLAAAEARANQGWKVDNLPVDRDGRLDLSAAAERLNGDTKLVCVMLANNETGVVQPIKAVGQIIRDRCPLAHFHIDATQTPGRLALDIWGDLAEADTLSISAHKFGGPKGIGALYARPGLKLPALVHGHQEEGLRGGTPNAAAAAGLATATRLARSALASTSNIAALRDWFESTLVSRLPGAQINGVAAERLPNTSSIFIPGLAANDAVDWLAEQGICVATGSACSSGSVAPSHVLLAMGRSHIEAKSTLRVSLSGDSTEAEIQLLLDALVELTDTTPP